MTAVLSLAFALSGAAGLIFEIVWFHRAGLVFGNSVVAATVVLSSFMAGLAIGNLAAVRIAARGRHLLHTYAALELTMAVTGVALTALLPRLSAFDVPLALAFGLLLVPAAAMGATLPILVAALRGPTVTRQSDCLVRLNSQTSFGWALGTLYGWNTFGAVAGALVAEFALIERVGVAGSAWVAASLDLIAAICALLITKNDRSDCLVRLNSQTEYRSPALLVCAGLSGFALLALEVTWFRFLSLFVLTTTQAMSVMLAVVLGGIAAGGLIAAVWTSRRTPSNTAIAGVALMAAAAVVVPYGLFGRLTTGTQIGAWPTITWFALVLTLPAAVVSGTLFTLFGVAIRARAAADVDASAALTFANTVGAAMGPPVAGFILLPALGTERAFFALALVYLASACLIAARDGVRRLVPIAIASLIIALLFPFGAMSAQLVRVATAYADDGSQVVATREGPTESIVLMQRRWMGKPIYSRLVTNGFSMSGTAIPGQRYMRYFVYWPMLMHETPLQKILVICYGAGVTASAAVDVPTATSIDIVELSGDVAAMSDVIYGGDRNPLRDPRVRLQIGDGRHFLQTGHDRFDLITAEPPPPRTPGTVAIYTREYFRLIRNRLADGGMATYWLPVARPHPGTDVDTIVRAFCDVFDDCSLWNATPFDFMLVGSRDGTGRFDPSRFPVIRDRLAEIGFETPEQIGATFLGDAAFLRALTASTPPLTDDFPQRLRPVVVRPSLSDPRYPDDPAVVAEYQRVIDPLRARDLFARSPLVARLWPAPMRDATRPWFDVQGAINRVLWEGGKPLRLIADLDATLTRTPLRTLPLWILDSDAVKQRIAASGNDGTGTVEYLRGAQMLATRDYESAASYFGLAERRGLKSPTLRPLIAYALCKAGRLDMSTRIMDSSAAHDDDERRFAAWMKDSCRAGGAGETGR